MQIIKNVFENRYLLNSGATCSPGAKLENGDLPYTESPLSFDGFN